MLIPALSFAQGKQNSFEVYGYILTEEFLKLTECIDYMYGGDAGYNFNAIDPAWFDVSHWIIGCL